MSAAHAFAKGQSAPAQENMDENDRLIQYTQGVRELIISEFMKTGKIPADKEDRDLLMKALDGATRFALVGKKIKSDEKAAQSQEALAIAIAQSTAAVLATRPTMPAGGEQREVMEVEVVEVPGMTHIGTQPINTADILNDESIPINAD